MNLKLMPSHLTGRVTAPPSKSYAHRILIAVALYGRKEYLVRMDRISEDIRATVEALRTLGCEAEYRKDGIFLKPIPKDIVNKTGTCTIYCGESGSTARFLLPVTAVLKSHFFITGDGRLPERPFSPLVREMKKKGCIISGDRLPMEVTGNLKGGVYELEGNVSSQFVTGLLFALPLVTVSSILNIRGELESAGYISITMEILHRFGILIKKDGNRFVIPGADSIARFYPGTNESTAIVRNVGNECEIDGKAGSECETGSNVGGECETDCMDVEGDWTNAAVFYTMNYLGAEITIEGLNNESNQGDRKIVEVLNRLQEKRKQCSFLKPQTLKEEYATVIDASQIPDIVPAIAVAAALTPGITNITHAGRLRLKESDRLASTSSLINSLGGKTQITQDGLHIEGVPLFRGGTVDGAGDHRIVMAAAIASVSAVEPVVITGVEAVDKSYPGFFEVLKELGSNYVV